MRSNDVVYTWADGFGRWHAKVVLDPPMGHPALRWDSVRAKARRAIRRELIERHGRWDNPTLRGELVVRIDVEDVPDPTGTGLIFSVTFVEKP